MVKAIASAKIWLASFFVFPALAALPVFPQYVGMWSPNFRFDDLFGVVRNLCRGLPVDI